MYSLPHRRQRLLTPSSLCFERSPPSCPSLVHRRTSLTRHAARRFSAGTTLFNQPLGSCIEDYVFACCTNVRLSSIWCERASCAQSTDCFESRRRSLVDWNGRSACSLLLLTVCRDAEILGSATRDARLKSPDTLVVLCRHHDDFCIQSGEGCD